MDFSTAVRTCFRKGITRKGRATREEFWYFQLFCAFTTVIFLMILALLFFMNVYDAEYFSVTLLVSSVIAFAFGLVLCIPCICASMRRLHDVGYSAWWILLSFVPIASALLLWWYAKPSQEGANAYGPNPHGVGNLQKDERLVEDQS